MPQPEEPTPADPRMRVSVRALCAFGARAGDLDFRFTPSPTPLEGLRGHQRAAARRPPSHLTEVRLQTRHANMTVHGRADGYDPVQRRVEELKTCRGGFEGIKSNHRALAWAQANTYAHMLCERDGLDDIEVAVVYMDVATDAEHVEARRCAADELRTAFTRLCEAYLAWAQQEHAHRMGRNAALESMRFPFPDFRAGQRTLAAAIYRAHRDRKTLLAEAR